MVRLEITASFLLASLHLVNGHGGGQHYIIDGIVHTGNWVELENTEGSIQRSWTWDHNVYDLENEDIACGHDGTPHKTNSYYAPIKAGNPISINYTIERRFFGGVDHTFGHYIGPMLAYMAACPEEGCEKVDLHKRMWFKTWHAGLLSGTWVDGHWAMRDVWAGANLDIPTPASLKPGKYLLRHEMINMQSGGTQWFPNCIQLEVSGSGNSLPPDEALVSFPGAYKDDLEKSFTYHGSEWIYTQRAKDTYYPMPGPPVWEG